MSEHENGDAQSTIMVLMVEDDKRLSDLTSQYLRKHGLIVTQTFDGHSGLAEAKRIRYDILLLDLMLPGIGGLEICRKIREYFDIPIIMITALNEEVDKIVGLETGADDYVTKPFSPRELLARIKANIRRARGNAGPDRQSIRSGELSLDPVSMLAALNGCELDLTSYEFELLRVLAENTGKVLGREQLMELAKGNADESFDRSIDVHISRLRSKLGDDPKKPKFIRTIRGVGYMYANGVKKESGYHPE